MIDIGMGEWVKEYNGYILMKFTSKYSYQQDFLDGKLYFNTADWFSMCEDGGRGDSNEGNTFTVNYDNPGLTAVNFEMVNGRAMIVQRDYSKNPEKYKKGTVWSYSAAKNRCRKIVSFYTAYVNTEKRIISEFSKNMSDEFGEYGVLILDRQQLFSRINDVFRKMKNCKEAQMGFVEYQTMSSGLNEWNPFRKDIDKFGYQNEFRITFVDDSREAVLLDLNQSLRDIAIPIIASEVDKEIYFDGKNLVYPIYKEIEI